jgi:hypothetical protein
VEIIKNISAEEPSGKLTKSNDQDDPYSAGETEARTWMLPEGFWGVLVALSGWNGSKKDNEVFQTTSRKKAKLTGKSIIPNRNLLSKIQWEITAREATLYAQVLTTEIAIVVLS